ncbi:hypothetical protein EXIGLDRAFT_81593 [Exidia glandulosa HHB12029]|uniref:Metaxin glutathione S-transferase domain-containing protein n=1 Tax=Exidia glandulosa HHB12029 TaxID=1314781 RepID=A0A165HMA4_EXIGL|nr:hypothetical protein EXIGLDRAFT_81593 [Exidia glandulosa HHB12029]
MSAKISTPRRLAAFYSHFPLKTLPEVEGRRPSAATPTLWIQPAPSSPLSADVDCLAAQALLALLGKHVALRTDLTAQGAVDGRLPNLQLPDGQLLPAHAIANWAGAPAEVDEARAWVSLLRSSIRPALLLHAPRQSLLDWSRGKRDEWRALLSPPPPPATGLGSPLPVFGTRVDVEGVRHQFAAALHALADRLGRDQWFLGASSPTALDATVFAYLHCAMKVPELRASIDAFPALVKWEQHVRAKVLDVKHQQSGYDV